MGGTSLSLGQFAELSAAVLKALPRDMSPTDALAWARNGEKLEKALRSALAPIAAPTPVRTLTLANTVMLGDIAGKKTAKCMSGNRWGYRDPDIDRLPEQAPLPGSSVGVYQLQQEGTTFREMAAAVLKVGMGTHSNMMASMLKERGHLLTLPVIEALVEKQESGEDVGLRTDGWANFAFVEDTNGSVSVVNFRRHDGQWYVYLYRLDSGNRWRAEYRLLVRNSDAPTL